MRKGAARAMALAQENQRLRQECDRAQVEQWRYEKLYDTAPVACFTLDEGGGIVEMNHTAARMLGTTRAALLGKPLARRVAAGDRGAFTRHLHETLSGGVTRSCQVLFEGSGGAAAFVGHLDSVPLSGPLGRTYCFMAVSDATERPEAARAHAEHLRKEQALHDAVLAAQHRFDRIAAVASMLAESLDVDEAAARAAHVAVPELASFCAVDLCDADGRVRRAAVAHADGSPGDLPLDPYASHGSAQVVRTGQPTILLQLTPGDALSLTTEPADLRVVWAAVGAYLCLPLQANGRTLGAMSFIRSCREAFTAEDVSLAEEIARHAALVLDNARLYREAQEMDQRKDEFLAMLAHELRNPLAAITFASTLLQANGGDAGGRKAGDVIRGQSARLVRLVDDLLDVSRITRNKLTLQKERVALDDAIARAVESVRPLIDERHHKLTLTQTGAPIILHADAPRLEQIIVNLLANAARYTPPGGRITLEITREGEEGVLRVEDTGMGIAPEMLQRIFAPFTRAVGDLGHADRGLGIGLTLSRSLVELHGGSLSAYSAGLGQGSAFVVRLPAPRLAREEPAPAELEPTSGPLRRRRLLLVEDEADLAEMGRVRLTALGQEVRVASDGEEAIATALESRPELLIIDVCLPGISGYDVARRLRGEATLAGAKLVALTGYGDEVTRRRCLDAGFDLHITKPISDEALRALLRDA